MKHEENGFQVAVDSQLHGVAVYVDSCGVCGRHGGRIADTGDGRADGFCAFAGKVLR